MVTVTQFPNYNKGTIDDLLYSLLLNFGGTMSDVKPIYNDTTKDLLHAILQKTETLGSGGGSAALTETVLTNITDGTIAAGVTLPNGMTFTEYVKRRGQTIFYPVLTAPSFSIANNAGSLREVGESINVLLTFNFNRGTIVINGTQQNVRAGAATGYTFTDAANNNYAGMPQGGNTFTVNAYIAIKGNNTFKGKVAYAAGVQPIDSTGANFSTPLASGESTLQSTAFEGVFPFFATTVNIATNTKLALFTNGNADVYFTAISQLGTGNQQKFLIATDDARAVTILAKNGLTGLYTINETTSWNKTAFGNITIQGTPKAYSVFTYTGADRGAIDLLFQLR